VCVASSVLLAAIFLAFAPAAAASSSYPNAQNPWQVEGPGFPPDFSVSSPAELISLVDGTPGVNGLGVPGYWSFGYFYAYTCNTEDGRADECVFLDMYLIDSTGQIADEGTPGAEEFGLVFDLDFGTPGQVCPSGAYVASGVSCPSTTQPAKLLGNMKNNPYGCNCVAGDPIDIASGNVYSQETDYATAGANKLSFARSYNSRAVAPTFAVSLGSNWRTNYDRYLTIVSSTQIVAERDDGQQVTFNLSGGAWTPDTDVDLTLTQSGTTWTLVDHNDNVEAYTAVSSNERY
jgi:hypothetical protein